MQTLQYGEDGAVATIRLHRPEKKNSLNAEMRHEMASLLNDLARKAAVRAVVITGSDEIFCAGADISEMGGPPDAESSYHHARDFQILFDGVESLSQPVIAAVSGFALGGGCELAIAADFRIASETARFGLPEIKIGAFPGGGWHATTAALDWRCQSERDDFDRRPDWRAGSARCRFGDEGGARGQVPRRGEQPCRQTGGAAPSRVTSIEDADQSEPGTGLSHGTRIRSAHFRGHRAHARSG